MFLETLALDVVKARPTADNATFQYHLKVHYCGATWELAKRFSEFDALLQNLTSCKYGGLPRLPAKTLIGAPTGDEAIDGRKQQLKFILHDLLIRPDTRNSPAMRHFLDIDKHAEVQLRSLQPEPLRSFEDPRFGVSGMSVAPRSNLVIVTHEDSTHLSRLGRVWSVVEPDELGALHLWAQVGDGSWKRVHSSTFGQKVTTLTFEEVTRQFFVGFEDGKIDMYSVAADSLKPSQQGSLDLHHKSPVTHLSASPRRLLSLGFDTAMRVIDLETRQLLCGGRLLKRLKTEQDYLTCGYLDEERDRVFIGSSGGDLFVFDIATNPPKFLHSLEMSTKPVSMLCHSGTSLFVGHGDGISVLSFEEPGHEQRMRRTHSYSSKHLHYEGLTILSVADAPHRGLVFGGYSDGSVAMWMSGDTESCMVLKAHESDVTNVAWIEDAPWGPALFTAGGDGKVTTWRLVGGPDDFVFWNAQTGVAAAPHGGGLPSAVSGAASAIAEAASVAQEQRNVNPAALKGNDSDSDCEDIVGAFH